jgi:hypothetical protein
MEIKGICICSSAPFACSAMHIYIHIHIYVYIYLFIHIHRIYSYTPAAHCLRGRQARSEDGMGQQTVKWHIAWAIQNKSVMPWAGMGNGHQRWTGKDVWWWWIQMFTKCDMTIGFEIQVKVSVFGKGRMCWPRDVDSGKVGTATSLNRVGCGQQHLKSPLHPLTVGCGPPER